MLHLTLLQAMQTEPNNLNSAVSLKINCMKTEYMCSEDALQIF